MLETGDLIFVREDTEMGQAIQVSTGNYSHVAIFLDGFIYHATVEGGSFPKPLRISLKLEKSMTFIAMRRLIVQRSKSGQKTF